jgi:hypothetical protein
MQKRLTSKTVAYLRTGVSSRVLVARGTALALLPPLGGSGFQRGGRELFPYSRSFLTLVLLFVGQLGWLWRVCALVWWSTFHG